MEEPLAGVGDVDAPVLESRDGEVDDIKDPLPGADCKACNRSCSKDPILFSDFENAHSHRGRGQLNSSLKLLIPPF